jgi:hypothetical protein
MELDFDRFIQSHFFQLDVLENARARDDPKGMRAYAVRAGIASFVYT